MQCVVSLVLMECAGMVKNFEYSLISGLILKVKARLQYPSVCMYMWWPFSSACKLAQALTTQKKVNLSGLMSSYYVCCKCSITSLNCPALTWFAHLVYSKQHPNGQVLVHSFNSSSTYNMLLSQSVSLSSCLKSECHALTITRNANQADWQWMCYGLVQTKLPEARTKEYVVIPDINKHYRNHHFHQHSLALIPPL